MEADPCIYIREFQVEEKGVQKTQYQIVALYVDDLIIAASTKNLLTALENEETQSNQTDSWYGSPS